MKKKLTPPPIPEGQGKIKSRGVINHKKLSESRDEYGFL